MPAPQLTIYINIRIHSIGIEEYLQHWGVEICRHLHWIYSSYSSWRRRDPCKIPPPPYHGIFPALHTYGVQYHLRIPSNSNAHIQFPQMAKYTEAAMQKAMQHARREPDIPILRLAQLYGVDKTTLGRRVKRKQGTQADARRDDQLFSPGEENAIIY